MFGITDYLKIAMLIAAMLGGAYIAHHWDLGKINALKIEQVQAQKAAMEWGLAKQKEYDDAAIKAAERFAQSESERATAAERRLANLPPPAVLIRGCLTYEFVRTLDAAIANRQAGTLPLPAGKSHDACAPIDAAAVARWLLGIIDAAQHNAGQLTALQAFIRDAQARR